MIKHAFLFSFVTLLTVGSAQAMPEKAQDRFAQMDTDKNGTVSWEEFSTAIPSMREQAFDSIDTDKNKAINREEWNTFSVGHGKPQGMPMQGMPSQGKPTGKPLITPPSQ